MDTLLKSTSQYVAIIHDHWVESDVLYLQMELCKNNLSETIDEIPQFLFKFEPKNIRILDYFIKSEIFKDILHGVNHLHKLDTPIIHRDLKPLNILVTFDGKFKLGDFGEAVFHLSESMFHTMRRGTATHMAPEVLLLNLQKNNYTTKVDVYSLGIILINLLNMDMNE